MPQFDPAVWSPQLVWLAITFVVMYLLMSRVALPRIGHILEERETRIARNLEKAESLKKQADEAVAAYEQRMADARARAQEALRQARDDAAEDAARRHAELSERLSERISAGEARIAEAEREAIASIRDIAIDVAAGAAQKLLGGRVDRKGVTAATDAALGEAG
ncbi:MAG: F0F1 ATP synthase subunit B' [Rhodospirillales bacterium]|nr:MAG: F0F1 ATP synthase subunit B' [Rhodospirillales bacterium]